MSIPSPSPLPRKSKLVYVYLVLLFGLALLDVFGIVNTLDAKSAIVRSLTPLRMFALGLGALCFSLAGILFLWRNAMGRWLVIVGLVSHYAYMLYYNTRVLIKDGPPSPAEIFGMVFGMAIFLALFAAIGTVPFKPRFTAYLKGQES